MKSYEDTILEREESIDMIIQETFLWALRQSAWNRLRNRVLGKENSLLSFDDVYTDAKLVQQHELGTHPVEIEQIVGSMGRVEDFDRNFFPRNKRSANRWMSIARAFHKSIGLDAVQLFKIGEHYFVKDGNHRISVAKAHGQDFIDAAVTEIVLA